LDAYSCTEGGVIATQTWDYEGMTFIPSLNFFEFIPEYELLKWQMDHSYKMKTLLLDEVMADECYEIVITTLHGGSLIRYRIGDMIRITSLSNDKLGISLPQMTFERRVTDIIDFVAVRFSEKSIWQALEKSGVPYEDWMAYKIPGEPILHLLVEPKNGYSGNQKDLSAAMRELMIDSGKSSYKASGIDEDWRENLDFDVDVTFLPKGTFDKYTAQRQSEGADLAHLKPPHVNPSDRILSLLLGESEEIIEVIKTGQTTENRPKTAKIPQKR
jgi:hypothetical protein